MTGDLSHSEITSVVCLSLTCNLCHSNKEKKKKEKEKVETTEITFLMQSENM